MKKKVVLVTGSARKDGNSMRMANSFANAAAKKDFEVVRFDATRANIGICHVCNTCFKSGKACSHNDDFNEIANEILNADGIVFAFPVYWYFFPACIKLLIDKFYSFWIGGHTMKGKKVALISCCEEDNMEAFDSINIAFDKSFHLLDADIVGKVEIKGVNEAGAIRSTDGELRAAELVELL